MHKRVKIIKIFSGLTTLESKILVLPIFATILIKKKKIQLLLKIL